MITDNQDIHFSGRLTFQEFRKGNGPMARKFLWYSFFLCLLIFFLISIRNLALLPSVIFAFFFALVVVLLANILLFLEYLLIYKIDPIFKQERHFSIQNDGVHVSTEHAESFYKWGEFRSVRQRKKLYFLYRSVFKKIIIPQRFFTNAKDQEAFERIIHDNIPRS